MGIEKDIQQMKFRNAYQKAVINLIYTSNWMREKTTSILEKGRYHPATIQHTPHTQRQ